MSHVTKLILIMQFITNLSQGWYLITPTNLKYTQDIAKVSCRRHVLAGLVNSRSQRVWDFFYFLDKDTFLSALLPNQEYKQELVNSQKTRQNVWGGGGRGEGRGGLTGSG